MKRLTTYGAAFVVALFAGFALAGTIKVWTAGEYITASDLNANFAHLHTTMVGGHGPRLVNADVAANANIATNKLAALPLIPRGYASVVGGATPTILAASGVSTVTRPLTGQYTVTIPARPNVNYVVLVTPANNGTGTPPGLCTVGAKGTTTFSVNCAGNSDFDLAILDND